MGGNWLMVSRVVYWCELKQLSAHRFLELLEKFINCKVGKQNLGKLNSGFCGLGLLTLSLKSLLPLSIFVYKLASLGLVDR